MNLNWGHKIGIAYTAFVLFMLFMVYKTTTVKFDLVVDDYYSEELKFQKQIDKEENLNFADFKVNIVEENASITLFFEGITNPELIIGNVMLYKPDNAALDVNTALNLSASGNQTVGNLTQGKYRVKLSFTDGLKDYYLEKIVNL
ncbi:MAG: FixH family protein [Luteibaculaceae bacterium]